MISPLQARTKKESYEELGIAIILRAKKDLKSDSIITQNSAKLFFSKKDNILFNYFGLNSQAVLEVSHNTAEKRIRRLEK